MVKLMFIGYAKAGVTREEYFEEWAGDRHTSIVKTVPGLKKWMQNRVAPEADENRPVGIGELWFESADAMQAAMESPEIEDGKSFVDLEKSYATVVEEKSIIG